MIVYIVLWEEYLLTLFSRIMMIMTKGYMNSNLPRHKSINEHSAPSFICSFVYFK